VTPSGWSPTQEIGRSPNGKSCNAMAKRVLDTGLHVTGATGDETLVFDKQ